MGDALFTTVQEEEPEQWTEFEVNDCLLKGEEFNSNRIKILLDNKTALTTLTTLSTPTTPAIRHTTNSTTEAEVTVRATPTNQRQTPTQLDNQTPQPVYTTEKDFGKELTNLAKIYTTESKYTGQDDNFDFKLVIFHDLCGRASVPDEAKAKAYPTMLSNLALDHYYTNLRNTAQTLPFDCQGSNRTRSYCKYENIYEGGKRFQGKLSLCTKCNGPCVALISSPYLFIAHSLHPFTPTYGSPTGRYYTAVYPGTPSTISTASDWTSLESSSICLYGRG